MTWFTAKLRSSFSALLGGSAPAPAPVGEVSLEHIRQTMQELVRQDRSERAAKLGRRIRYANDVETLWYLRGELMGLLARIRGEAAAQEEIERLSNMFSELLPSGLRSRPSPLRSNQRGER